MRRRSDESVQPVRCAPVLEVVQAGQHHEDVASCGSSAVAVLGTLYVSVSLFSVGTRRLKAPSAALGVPQSGPRRVAARSFATGRRSDGKCDSSCQG